MRNHLFRSLLCLSTILVTACSGDDIMDNPSLAPDAGVTECVSEVGTIPSGIFSSIADLPDDGCNGETLENIDVSGLWYLYAPGDFTASPVRIESSCESGMAASVGDIMTSMPFDYTRVDETGIFLYGRQEGEWSQTRAYRICAKTNQGSLYGHSVSCYEGPDAVYCDKGTFEMLPFERLDEDDASGLSLVSEFRGSESQPWPDAFTAAVAVHQDIAYLANGHDGLRIVDISDPATPSELAHLAINEDEAQFRDSLNDVAVVDHDEKTYAILAGNYTGLYVVDVSNPAEPMLIDMFNPFAEQNSGVHEIIVETIDDTVRAYVASGSVADLLILDVTDPSSIQSLGAYQAANPDWAFHSMFAKNGRVYINATVGGMIVIDTLVNPASPTVLGRFESGDYSHFAAATEVDGRPIVVHGGEGYDAHAKILDADPESETFLEVLGTYQTRAEVSIHNMVAVGDKVYIAYYQDGVRVLDLSDPTNPSQIAHYNTWDPETAPGTALEGAVDVQVDEAAGYVYVGDTPRGLLILKIE